MKEAVVFLLFLLAFSSVLAKSKFNATTIKGELRKPGVKLVAIDFYMTGCPPCDAAIPVWKKLKKEYGDALKLIVVAPQSDDGTCNVKGWNNVKMVCDEDMEIASAWGVKDFPQAFLYSWHNNDPLVELGHVNDVEKAIKEYFKHIPRVAIDANKSTKNLVPIVEEELIRNSKIELVSEESDRLSLLAAKKKSHQLNYDEGLKCELGKEIAANSILKVTKQDEDLVLKLSSVEKSCTMAAATKMLSGNKGKLKTEIASAVYDLLSQMFGNISIPERGERSVSTQSFLSQNNSSTRDANACKYAREENSLEAWQDYLESFADGDCSFEAKSRIRKLKKEHEQEKTRKREAKSSKYYDIKIHWIINSRPQGADCFWSIKSSTPNVKNQNERYLAPTPYESTESINIKGLSRANAGDVRIEIRCEKQGYYEQKKVFDVLSVIDEKEISTVFFMVKE